MAGLLFSIDEFKNVFMHTQKGNFYRYLTRSVRRRCVPGITKLQKYVRYKLLLKRTQDPITMNSLSNCTVICIVEPDGSSQMFDALILALYIKETGDARHPLTRRELSTPELMRLQRTSGLTLDIDEIQQTRARQLELLSLGEFFMEEIRTQLRGLIELVRLRSGNIVITRHLISVIFPVLILNVCRAHRVDPSVSETILEELDRYGDMLGTEAEACIHYMYTRLLQDLHSILDDLQEGQQATLHFGDGLAMSIVL